jgi:hypothetical protein
MPNFQVRTKIITQYVEPKCESVAGFILQMRGAVRMNIYLKCSYVKKKKKYKLR